MFTAPCSHAVPLILILPLAAGGCGMGPDPLEADPVATIHPAVRGVVHVEG